jgi:protein ImuA
MQDVARQHNLSALRARIAAIEKRPLLAGPAGSGDREVNRGVRGWAALLAPPAGLLHEVYADEPRNGGAALGFALGLAKGLLTPERPALLMLQLAHAAQDLGLPYGAGLSGFGIAPEALLLGRLANLPELLWAIEEAIACRAIAAVIAEVPGEPKALDFTASRRLSLRAASGGASVLLLRHGQTREASAARLRWRVTPAPSLPPPFDAAAPGSPRWRVTLEKGGLPQRAAGGNTILVDWTEHGFAPAVDDSAEDTRALPRPAPSGALPAALGDRLSQAG